MKHRPTCTTQLQSGESTKLIEVNEIMAAKRHSALEVLMPGLELKPNDYSALIGLGALSATKHSHHSQGPSIKDKLAAENQEPKPIVSPLNQNSQPKSNSAFSTNNDNIQEIYNLSDLQQKKPKNSLSRFL